MQTIRTDKISNKREALNQKLSTKATTGRRQKVEDNICEREQRKTNLSMEKDNHIMFTNCTRLGWRSETRIIDRGGGLPALWTVDMGWGVNFAHLCFK